MIWLWRHVWRTRDIVTTDNRSLSNWYERTWNNVLNWALSTSGNRRAANPEKPRYTVAYSAWCMWIPACQPVLRYVDHVWNGQDILQDLQHYAKYTFHLPYFLILAHCSHVTINDMFWDQSTTLYISDSCFVLVKCFTKSQTEIIALINALFDDTNNRAVSCSLPRMIRRQLVNMSQTYVPSTTNALTRSEDLVVSCHYTHSTRMTRVTSTIYNLLFLLDMNAIDLTMSILVPSPANHGYSVINTMQVDTCLSTGTPCLIYYAPQYDDQECDGHGISQEWVCSKTHSIPSLCFLLYFHCAHVTFIYQNTSMCIYFFSSLHRQPTNHRQTLLH